MSEAAFLQLPEEKPYLELHDGIVAQKAVPKTDHGRLAAKSIIAFNASAALADWDYGPERRVRLLNGRLLIPDVAAWAPGRPNGDDSIPTVAVEIRSRDESMASQRRKCEWYREGGVEACWLIDPVSRTVEVFEARRDRDVLGAGDVLRSAALPGFELDVAALFAVLDR